MSKKRFKQIHYENLDSPSFKCIAQYMEIIKDLDTGILYCLSAHGANIAMTPLLGCDGKPIIDDSE